MVTMMRERNKHRRCMIHISTDLLHFTCQPVQCHVFLRYYLAELYTLPITSLTFSKMNKLTSSSIFIIIQLMFANMFYNLGWINKQSHGFKGHFHSPLAHNLSILGRSLDSPKLYNVSLKRTLSILAYKLKNFCHESRGPTYIGVVHFLPLVSPQLNITNPAISSLCPN